MLEVTTRRGLLSILGGHVLWTAMVGAALWKGAGRPGLLPRDDQGPAMPARLGARHGAPHGMERSPRSAVLSTPSISRQGKELPAFASPSVRTQSSRHVERTTQTGAAIVMEPT